MATATYSASLRTRKTSSSSNAKSDRACQEFYSDDYNYVGIIHFSGMSLANKVITGIKLTVSSAQSGYGAGHTKTVYMRKSKYQAVAQSGITGYGYTGDALGTFTGSFYNNTTSYTITGTLLTNMAAYIQAGNNTFTIYNPNPVASSYGYSTNFFQWTSVTMTVTYEEAASVPTVSSNSVAMGSSVTIYTNRASTAATHTITYAFGSTSGTIASSVGASTTWTPPLSLATQIPSATSGLCTITCKTYVNSTLTGTKTVSITLTVPSSVVPTISTIACVEATSGIAAQFAAYVRTKSTVTVTITAAGARGSSISSYRTTLGGTTYTASTFTSATLNTAGSNTISVTVTDSRGRTATKTATITVVDYASPSLTSLSAQRCNSDGSAAQMDGTKVRITTAGSVSSVGSKNTVSCTVYYKLSTATAWTTSTNISSSNYTISATNLLLSQTFDVLKSYDIKVRLTDFFGYVEQTVSVGTKQVMMDFYKDGSGIAFGKVAESSGTVEFGWPVELAEPLPIAQGGTGQTTVAAARNAMGLGNTSGALPIANGGTGKTTVAAARNALGLGNTSGAVPVANGGTGATTAAAARTNLGVTLANLGAAASSHNHAASAITSGTLAAARLPFKYAMGSATINGNSSITVSYPHAKPAQTLGKRGNMVLEIRDESHLKQLQPPQRDSCLSELNRCSTPIRPGHVAAECPAFHPGNVYLSTDKLVWNVIYHDLNAQKILPYNIFRHQGFLKDVQELLKKCEDKTVFASGLRRSLMYYFWCKSEWEIIIGPWAGNKTTEEIKVDVCWQIMNNWDHFVDYVWCAKRRKSRS